MMIGILLALQVNEWNTARTNKQLEQEYYCRLLEDIVQDSIQLYRLLEENEYRIENSNALLAILQKPQPSREEVTDKMGGSVSKTVFVFKPHTAAFEDLKSSGNLNIIRDFQVKNELIDYYSTLEGYRAVVLVNSEGAVNTLYNQDNDFVDMGWQTRSFVREALDTTIVNLDALNAGPYMTDQLRKKLTSDALFYLNTNARKKLLYGQMADVIKDMKLVMLQKCPLGT